MIPNLLELVTKIEVPNPYTKYYEPYWLISVKGSLDNTICQVGNISNQIRNKKASLVKIDNKWVVHNRNCYIPDLDHIR
ncbi:hypothetical protein BH18THE2_BH18THE2_24070 [soil metagenome]